MSRDDHLVVDLIDIPVQIIKIERRRQTAGGDGDWVIDYLIRLEYELGMGKNQHLDVYVDEIPPGLQVGGTNLYLCIEARS